MVSGKHGHLALSKVRSGGELDRKCFMSSVFEVQCERAS